MKVADEVWIAVANLHRNHPDTDAFSHAEILEEVARQGSHPELRPGVSTHIAQHCVANLPPNPGGYRMLFRTETGKYRLFRESQDRAHPGRSGKVTPAKADLPVHLLELIDWYHDKYDIEPAAPSEEDDPVLRMRGVGKEMWAAVGGGEAYLASERQKWNEQEKLARVRRQRIRRKAS